MILISTDAIAYWQIRAINLDGRHWLQRFQTYTRWLLIGYTALTIVVWYFIEASHADLFDYSDKLIEVVLIALLLIEGWQTRQRTA